MHSAPADVYDAFISYSNLDSENVHGWLIPGLRNRGVSIYVDEEQILPGDVIFETLSQGIRQSRFVVFVFSRSFLSSRWTRHEYQVCVHENIERGRSRPLAAKLTECEIPSPLDISVYADFTRIETREEELNKLAAQIRGDRRIVGSFPVAPAPAPARYRNFDVTLTPPSGDDYGLRVLCEPIGGRIVETVRLDREALRRRTMAVRAGTATRAECEDLGAQLHRMIFTPAVARMWERAHESASRTTPATLRVRLRTPDADTTALPWELLHDGTSFLTVAGHYPIVRYFAELEETSFAAIPAARVLLAGTSGQNGLAKVHDSLDPLLAAGKLGHVGVLENASLTDLYTALREQPCHVIHLIADCDDAGRLLLHDRDGAPLAVTGERLELLLHDSPVQLLVLSGNEAAAGSVLQLAFDANRFGVPAVLALQRTDEAATFLDELYRVLADGCPIETCVAAGRKSMVIRDGWEQPHWALPVLFNDHPDAMLFRAESRDWCAVTKRDRPSDTRVAPPPANNLPPAGVELVEREDALHALETAVTGGKARVVLVKGPAGVGKTALVARFAADAAAQNVDRWTSIVWIAPAIAEATGMQQLPRDPSRPYTLDGMVTMVLMTVGRGRLARLDQDSRVREAAALLAEGRHLIVIDDAGAASADALRAFIQAMPKTVRFVVTASERLEVGEDVELALTPLEAGFPFVLRAEMGGFTASATATPESYARELLRTLPQPQLRILGVCATLPFPAMRTIVARAAELDDGACDEAANALLARGILEQWPSGQLALCGTLRTLFRETSGLEPPAALDPVLNALRDHAQGAAWHPYRAAMVEPELGNLIWAMQRAYLAGRLHDLKALRMAVGDSLYRLDYWRIGAAVGELAFLAASGTSDHEEMAWAAIYPIARVLYHGDELAAAERWCATALAIFEAQQHHEGIAAAQRYLGRIKQSQGDRVRARRLFSAALERAWRTPQNRSQLGLMLSTMAAFERSENNHGEAERLYHEALAQHEPEGKPESIAPSYDALGRIALARGDGGQALTYFQRAREVLRHLKWGERHASVAFSIGLAHEALGQLDTAVHELETAKQMFADIGARAPAAAVDAALLRLSATSRRAAH